MTEVSAGDALSGAEATTSMKAARYTKPGEFALVTLPVPQPKSNEIPVKVKSCGICGSDLDIHSGNLDTRMPVITGHETSGIVVKMGTEVQVDGGFAEYCVFPAERLFRFEELSWEEATLFEAASCAVHGMDRIKPAVGSTVLLIGSGLTGLCLSQLLQISGGRHVVLASNQGRKMDLAKQLNAADQYVELDRENPEDQWRMFRSQFPHEFDIVIEATGYLAILEMAINFCTRGRTLLYYGVYAKETLIQVSPSKVFMDEIIILG